MKRNIILSLVSLLGCSLLHGQSNYVSPSFLMERDSLSVADFRPGTEDGLMYNVNIKLEGRTVIGRPQPLRDMPVQSGDVVLEIKVNRYGEVSMVSLVDKGTTIIDRDLIDDVCDDAMNTLFNESGTAPVFQMGRMVYHFEIPVPKKDTVYLSVSKVNVDSLAFPVREESVSDEVVITNNVKSVPVEEHLEFKKIYIDGPLSEFVNSLRNTGLTYKGIKGDIGFLEGTFAGINNTRIYVLSINDVTYKVIVDFPGQETWPSMKKQYLYFKNSYTSKYFSTPRCVEKFPNFIPEGSGREYNAFKEEAAVYMSSFDVPNGLIVMSVQPSEDSKGKFFLRIEYTDGKNSSRREQEALEDI